MDNEQCEVELASGERCTHKVSEALTDGDSVFALVCGKHAYADWANLTFYETPWRGPAWMSTKSIWANKAKTAAQGALTKRREQVEVLRSLLKRAQRDVAAAEKLVAEIEGE